MLFRNSPRRSAVSDDLYPEIEPYETAFLGREGHRLYYELS